MARRRRSRRIHVDTSADTRRALHLGLYQRRLEGMSEEREQELRDRIDAADPAELRDLELGLVPSSTPEPKGT